MEERLIYNHIIDMTKYNCAFTYRKNVKAKDRASVTESDYDQCLKQIRNFNGVVLSHYFERDSKQRLHVHGLCEIDTKLRYRALALPGFSSCFKKCWSVSNWLDYCKKDQKYCVDTVHELTQLSMLHDYETQLGSEKTHGQAVTEIDVPLRTSHFRQSDDDEPLTPKEGRIQIPTKKLF